MFVRKRQMTTVPNLPKFIVLQKDSSVEIIEEQLRDSHGDASIFD
jgi:hypothetical protein